YMPQQPYQAQPQYIPQQPYPQQPYPQQPYPQQPYPQQPYPAAPAPKKSKKGLVIFLSAAAAFLLGIVGIVIALGGAGKKDYYDLGNDQVPSVALALGEQRKISGSKSSNTNGVIMKEYKYNEPDRDQADEMTHYVNYLRGEGFQLLTDVDFSTSEAWCELGRDSADAGNRVLVKIAYDRGGYVITLTKEPGGFSPIDEDPEEPTQPVNQTGPVTPGGPAYVGMWRGKEVDEDGDAFISLMTFNKDGTFSWSVNYVEVSEYDGKAGGSFTLEDGVLSMTGITTADGRSLDDMTAECSFTESTMTLDGTEYVFVEPRDRRRVSANPLEDYP
ncbi:MAG: hypothetical protein FWC27_12720, partial [Firmicutes bacterium]|nr:hypothetical protein [Bacillota bacterium]